LKRAAVLGVFASIGMFASAQGCWSGTPASLGLDEPIRVRGATFETGDLPGARPLTDREVDAGVPLAPPHVTTVNSLNNVLRPGEVGKSLNGGVTDDADAVAIRFVDIGSGYWVIPAAGPDPSKPGELTWSMSLDVAESAPKGLHKLLFAGIDKAGHAGTQNELDFCIDSAVPDNENACDPTIEPPFAVISLTWDTNADLDLELVTPDGKVVDPKHPTTATETDAGPAVNPAIDGVIDRDSNRGCVIDGFRREDAVFQSHPRNGQYLVYVNMFAACGQPAARFEVTLSLAEKHGDHYALVPALTAGGELVAQDQNGGAALGLFVTQFSFD
jgi:hypothetical protein